MISLNGLEFTWISGKKISNEQLEECSRLYGEHYGVYGEGAESLGLKPGQRIKMRPKMMRRLLDVDGAFVAMAHLKKNLVAYVFLMIGSADGGGDISWATQLVVHTDYRNQKVATRLLHAAWGLSDRFAWGLATANPYAVRALEAATRRPCEPTVTAVHVEQLRRFTGERIFYFNGIGFDVGLERSVVNTRFFVNHDSLAEKMERVRMNGKPWNLGTLAPGTEWLAVTFQSQAPRPLTIEDLDRLLADQDGIVKEAYARMLLDTAHKWMKNTPGEVDFAVANLGIQPGGTVLDAGCGVGRHAIELAKRGYRVVGVDFVASLVDRARQAAEEAGVAGQVQFRHADCRTLRLDTTFDGALCLYDVVGSFPQEEDNKAILAGIARHMKPGSRILMSVLNRGLVEAEAIQRGPIRDNLQALLQLPPSSTMQESGEIFKPQFYLYDNAAGIVYRKEQFKLDDNIPCELIVRDRRYFADELRSLCASVDIRPLWARHVRMGRWDDDLSANDTKAKEVLLLGQRG
jgi:2-polyprenyl-3-methyl-5-hydroxy-6-metoxy-1,4-benzoquinol methylase